MKRSVETGNQSHEDPKKEYGELESQQGERCGLATRPGLLSLMAVGIRPAFC